MSIVVFAFLFSILIFSIALTQSAFADEFSIKAYHIDRYCYIDEECFIPTTIEIALGDTVTWVTHQKTMTIRSLEPQEEFEALLSLDSPTFSHTYLTLGTFEYYSQTFPWMKGQVVVRDYRLAPIYFDINFTKPAIIPKPIEEKEIDFNTSIPEWIKNSAQWWGEGVISDSEFILSIEFLIKNKIIDIDSENVVITEDSKIPSWVRKNVLWWAYDLIPNSDFLSGIKYLIQKGIINVPQQNTISPKTIEKENISLEVWKKFVRTNQNFNMDEVKKTWYKSIANPRYVIENGVGNVYYDVLASETPSSTILPFDYKVILDDSLNKWSEVNENLHFRYTDRIEANILVAWVIEDLEDRTIGHAHLGKGGVEVMIGDKGCNGFFELYTKETAQNIMLHEIGHAIGLFHVDDPQDIMNPSIPWMDYEFCKI